MKKRMRKILIADDDSSARYLFGVLLRGEPFELAFASTGREARALIEATDFDIILTDVELGDLNGLELLSLVKELKRKSLVIILTGHGSVKTAVRAIQDGAFDYVTKPDELSQVETQLQSLLHRAVAQLESQEHADTIPADLPRTVEIKIIGESPEMGNVFRAIARAAMSKSNVLVVGESGTGKELVAKAIHENSVRSGKPFVAVHCGALAESLLESELFGHIKGSFTGAISNKIGLFEEANGGTIFLDEIGDISPALQIKLLRVLQEGEFKPVGASENRKSDLRVIAATHRDLSAMVRNGTFREDLFYRLKVIVIDLPPLRTRSQDIPLLANHFLAQHATQSGKSHLKFADDTIEVLCRYPWPGNVRELENAIERAVAMSSGDILFPEDFPEEAPFHASVAEPESINLPSHEVATTQSLSDVEREHILKTLKQVKFNKSKAAEVLGVDRVTLYRKIMRYAISMSDPGSRTWQNKSINP